jgi:hypothetical protein
MCSPTVALRLSVQGDVLELFLRRRKVVERQFVRFSVLTASKELHRGYRSDGSERRVHGRSKTHLNERPDLHALFIPPDVPLLPVLPQPFHFSLYHLRPLDLFPERLRREGVVRREMVEEGGRDTDLRTGGGGGVGEAGGEGGDGGGCADDFVVACEE